MNTKPFKTLNKQMKILRDRGLSVQSSAKRDLEQIGYYSLINGYKWLFLQRDSNGHVLRPEQYRNGATFEEIRDLYEFDVELRSALYDAILKYESILRAEISYRFSEKYPQEHSYLAIDNYNRDSRYASSVVGTISSLSNTIKRESITGDKNQQIVKRKKLRKKDNNAVHHYINKHGHVPLWVLVNFLTFGDINYFYRNIIPELQIEISKDFKDQRTRSYNNKKQSAITPNAIKSVNHIVNLFRNSVAHGEITYSKKIYNTPNLQDVKDALNQINLKLSSQAGVFELLIILKVVLPKKNYESLFKRVTKIIKIYDTKFKSVPFTAVLQDMNFPSDYIFQLKP
ncbi:Abi family protein [Lentilactobacillus senioris]|uniref:Abi family protein n=1 Tax=Lentilactobacillus senioris TaxID=931534 RepID=UPI003D2ACA32